MLHKLTTTQTKRLERLKDLMPKDADLSMAIQRISLSSQRGLIVELGCIIPYLDCVLVTGSYADLAYFEASANRMQQIIAMLRNNGANA